MNKTSDIVTELSKLQLSIDEAKIYIELLREPNTHLQLSHVTGINRTKVYRLIEHLEKRSLIYRRTDDRGTFLVASEPSALEVSLIAREQELIKQRQTLQHLVPVLSQLQGKDSRAFVVRTYEGEAGLKQMCWHELKTQGEVLALGNGTIEQLVNDDSWAEKHRDRQIVAGYKIRELINWNYSPDELPDQTSQKLIDADFYKCRILPSTIITFDNQTVIYNDTVAIYHWKYGQKVGVEIISATYAQMMRQIFESYWESGQDV
jgi:DNA-binding MarR family transcriptional regulator